MNNFLRILPIAVFVFGSAGVTAAQQNQTPTPSPAPTSTQKPPEKPADSSDEDLSITANVRARELRFEVVPNPNVEFPGTPKRITVWEDERQNLPRPVQPGVTYRNFGIQLRITSRFADIERIVAEALGEIPVSDDAPPANTENPPAPIQPAQTTTSNQTPKPKTDAPKSPPKPQ